MSAGKKITRINTQKALFITGTDTGVGKTIVAAGLVRLARMTGLRGVGVKPVETGCPVKEGVLFPEDGVFLQKASENDFALDACAPFRFSLPASPARAAAMEGRRLDIVEMEEHIRAVASTADFTAVEGAGGLMAPLQGDLMMIDLVERLGYPVLLVARTRLGTINHTLLSLQALNQRGIAVEGIVLSQTINSMGPEEKYTPKDLARLVKDVPLVALPYLNGEHASEPTKIAEAMKAAWPNEIMNRWLGLSP
jgi:dethiobiotin synthetase